MNAINREFKVGERYRGLVSGHVFTVVEVRKPGEYTTPSTVSYTHLRAHETDEDLVCRLLLEKNFFNDTATTEIYTSLFVGSVRCV